MFSNFFLKSFRILLFPFALLYWLAINIRNWLFDKNILKSISFGLPLICIGNLTTGGTGKSPMVEYILRSFKGKFKMATLSRGYKRKTKGYALASDSSTALEIGDEPMLFHLKFPAVPVTVGEERLDAIRQLLHDKPETDVIILDDAFQHRTIRAGFNILLTDFRNLFTRDFYLPTGDLRDLKRSYRRADIIIVTKCYGDLDVSEKEKITKEINPLKHQHVFFTAIDYGKLYHITSKMEFIPGKEAEILLVTGIANPRPLQEMLEEQSSSYHMLSYPDHHIFTIDDLKEIMKKFNQIETANKIILTTEKDAVRLVKFNQEISFLPFYVIPLKHYFLFDEGHRFESILSDFILNFKKAS